MDEVKEEREKILIAPYNKKWPLLFKEEKGLLSKILNNSQIQHIGSTSVPGLSAKPLIDMMASVKELEDVNYFIDSLFQQGYKYIPEIELQTPDRKFFQKRSKFGPWYHLSLTPVTSGYWIDHILFRDYLREHKVARDEYGNLKLILAEKHVDNFDTYNADKTDFILGVIEKAKQENKF